MIQAGGSRAILGLPARNWPVPGSEDTELDVLMEPEAGHGTSEVYTRTERQSNFEPSRLDIDLARGRQPHRRRESHHRNPERRHRERKDKRCNQPNNFDDAAAARPKIFEKQVDADVFVTTHNVADSQYYGEYENVTDPLRQHRSKVD